jgi:ATP-dependent DNA helicase RecG
VEVGLVEARGEGPGRVYHLSANIYRRLGDKAGYVRQRGFDGVQQEQMVLKYAQSHGRVTRSEVAELCRLSSEQARAVLQRLVKQGALAMLGERKGAFYEPVEKIDQPGQAGRTKRRR